MRHVDGPVRPAASALLEEGLDALRRALSTEPRERRGAYDLLVADALLTWAAEAALEDADAGRELEAMVGRVAGAGGRPDE